ncbi:protein tolQ [Sulfuricella sp. T08]|uniref:protein TolQ n=1 Tax=Sulfuricella sp. T08 TaxID=1632857 RepID=UPI0006179EB8|nr:protein TolQ [Sulfuricella sp. T08]GAO35803.1 protein tolQ [Sulfuricella sp. T08]
MNVTQDLSFLSLITNASIVVQLVLLILLLASGLSWYFIFGKMFAIRAAIREADNFENDFWSGSDINNLYQRSNSGRTPVVGMEKIFEAGYREFLKLKRQGRMDISVVMEGTRRAMRAACQRELDALERHLAFLASVGSVSPYIGLFGTVWGIMNAFRGLSNVVQATLAHVAPGIAEALVATAMGLFAAIPAVLAYNSYSHDVDRLATRYDSFMEEFSNILQRQPNP